MFKNRLFIPVLLIVLFGTFYFLDNRLNKDYYDYKTVKVNDNEFLILKRNSEISILKLKNQSIETATANYDWFIGKEANIDLNNSNTYKTGSGITGDGINKNKLTPIKFSDYLFYWSPNTNGKGFIYLNHYPEVNENNGLFYWIVVPEELMTNSKIRNLEPKMKPLGVKKENLISWAVSKI
ncbi:hypothetical protein [Rufibacter hautae]|nr:hypothetical protein [Rufibacter hautae]